MKQRTVFASYSRKDDGNVLLLVGLMRSVGNDVFKDSDSIMPGSKWRTEICTALEDAEIVMVFWSKNSSISDWVKEEYEKAIELGKTIIPVLLDSTPLPYPLNEYQYVDLRKLWKPKTLIEQTLLKRKQFIDIDSFFATVPDIKMTKAKLDLVLIKELLPAALTLKSKVGIFIGEN